MRHRNTDSAIGEQRPQATLITVCELTVAWCMSSPDFTVSAAPCRKRTPLKFVKIMDHAMRVGAAAHRLNDSGGPSQFMQASRRSLA